jgi:hypothetical protein
VPVAESFAALLEAVVARGLPAGLLSPGRHVDAPDLPASVAATYAVADGLDVASWTARFEGLPRDLLPMAEFLGEQRARDFIAMSEHVSDLLGEDAYWERTWWPLLTASPKDVVAVDRLSGDVWFSYSEAGIKEVIAPSLDAYWSACARWVEHFTFDVADGLWIPADGYRQCEGPWNPDDLGTGTTSTLFPTVGQ